MENFNIAWQLSILLLYSVVLLTLLTCNASIVRLINSKLPASIWKSGLDGQEIARKFSHFFSGLILAILPLIGADFWVPLCIGVNFFFLLVATKRNYFKFLNLDYLHSKRSGAIIFPIALIVMSLFFYQESVIFVTSMLILAICDPLAAVFGMIYGRKRRNGKSLAGLFAFMTSCLCLLLIVVPQFGQAMSYGFVGYAVLMSVVIAGGEFYSKKGMDNFVIPVLASILLGMI